MYNRITYIEVRDKQRRRIHGDPRTEIIPLLFQYLCSVGSVLFLRHLQLSDESSTSIKSRGNRHYKTNGSK